MLIDQIKCNHLDKPLEFIKNIHGDEISYLNARSAWKCPDCGKIIFRSWIYEEEEISTYKDYIFHVGDKVETIDKKTGYIKRICHCDACKLRGFDELMVSWDDNSDDYYITGYQAKNNFPNFKKIGKYTFNHNKENKIEKLNKEHPLIYTNETTGLKYTAKHWDGKQFNALTIGSDIIDKINKLIDVVNDLQESAHAKKILEENNIDIIELEKELAELNIFIRNADGSYKFVHEVMRDICLAFRKFRLNESEKNYQIKKNYILSLLVGNQLKYELM